jgi:hypothetical protein
MFAGPAQTYSLNIQRFLWPRSRCGSAVKWWKEIINEIKRSRVILPSPGNLFQKKKKKRRKKDFYGPTPIREKWWRHFCKVLLPPVVAFFSLSISPKNRFNGKKLAPGRNLGQIQRNFFSEMEQGFVNENLFEFFCRLFCYG